MTPEHEHTQQPDERGFEEPLTLKELLRIHTIASESVNRYDTGVSYLKKGYLELFRDTPAKDRPWNV